MPMRKQPKHSVETFANKLMGPEDYIETPVDTEDFGAVVFRMGATHARVHDCEPSLGRTEERAQHRDLRDQVFCGLEPGAAR